MKLIGNLPLVAAVAAMMLIGAGCQKSTTGSASGPNAGMANSDNSAMGSKPGGAPPASNPTAGMATPAAAPALDDADRNFMMKAAQGGLFEVDAGQLAETHASNAKVKAFAERMVTDHTNADNQLASLAQKDQVTLPTSLPADEQSQLDRLKSLNGRAFDRAYSELMVKDHQQDVSDFQQATTTLSDSDLRNFAQQTLPTLQDHLTLAESLPGEHRRMQASARPGSRRANP